MRSVAIAIIAAGIPVVATHGAAAATIDPATLLDIKPDQLVLPDEATAWTPTSVGPPLVISAHARSSLAPDPVSLPIGGILMFGYKAHLNGGWLHVYVDGVEVQTLYSGDWTRELALSDAAANITWTYVPSSVHDTIELTLAGARDIVGVQVLEFSNRIWRFCGDPEPQISFDLSLATPIGGAGVVLYHDGDRTVGMHVYNWIDGGATRHVFVWATIPPMPDGTPTIVNATIQDITGKVWDAFGGSRSVVQEVYSPIGGSPDGWVYDLRPTIGVGSVCERQDFSNIALSIDGTRVTTPFFAGPFGASYRFDHDLAFNETHHYKFDMTIDDGSIVSYEGTIREGLDHVDIDVPHLALTWDQAAVTLDGGITGKDALGDLRNPDVLPPVYADARAVFTDAPAAPIVVDDAHLHAVFAPLGILCYERAVSCSPYLGEAPGFVGDALNAATLTITSPRTDPLVLSGAGQFVAASRLTVLGKGDQEYVEDWATWAQDLATHEAAWSQMEAGWGAGFAEGQLPS